MCEFVDVNYNDIDFQKDGWYLEHTWTRKDELEFKNWLMNYLEDSKIRKTIMKYPLKQNIEKFADFFILNYGWKTTNV